MTRPTDEDLEQARWDLQVATGQTVAGTGVEGRMREARAAAGRLAAGLPELLDELEQLRRAARPTPAAPHRTVEEIRADLATPEGQGSSKRLSPTGRLVADVAPLLAEVERLSAELADARAKIERLTGASECNHLAKVEWFRRAVAAERALEAVRALCERRLQDVAGAMRQKRNGDAWNGIGHLQREIAALSAASPTTSDEVATGDCVNCEKPMAEHHLRHHSAGCTLTCWPTASDEPARCPHGDHAFEPGIDTDMEAEGRSPDPRWCNVCGEGVPWSGCFRHPGR